MPRVIHDTQDVSLPHATVDGESLWLARGEVALATGWDWKPQGLCRDDACMPIPAAAVPAITDADRLDIAAVWRDAGWPVVHDAAADIWVLGSGSEGRTSALSTLEAPDFELPDLDGRPHRLADYRGRRVFMVAWASW